MADIGNRKRDVEFLERALKTGQVPKHKRAAAKRSLQAIRNETGAVKEMRRWMEREHRQGRSYNVENAYEDAAKYEKYRNPGF